MKKILCHSSLETQSLAIKIAPLLKVKDIIGLKGDLGSGKTFFVKEIVTALNIHPPHRVTSPTFALMNIYPADLWIYHFDLYRIQNFDELYHIGFEDSLEKDAIFFIEWIDRCDRNVSRDLDIYFKHVNRTKRSLELKAHSSRGEKIIEEIFLKGHPINQ